MDTSEDPRFMLEHAQDPTPTRTSATSGFTIVEMLIALVMAGVLAGGVVSLLRHQSDFYGQNDDTIYAEQTARGTAELMASELRMASPEDIEVAAADSVAVRFDVLRAVVCGSSGSTVYTYVFDEPASVNLPSGRGTTYFNTDSVRYYYDDGFDGSGTAATSTSAASYVSCTSANGGVPQSADLSRYRAVDWSGSSFAGPAVPPVGSVVRVYGNLSYSFGPSSFSSGTALWRNDQELVAPFDGNATFDYVMADGSVQSSVSSTSFGDIRAIRVDATAIGSGSNRYDVARDLSFDVSLRNLHP